jgi:predicted Zn-dependent peptidase
MFKSKTAMKRSNALRYVLGGFLFAAGLATAVPAFSGTGVQEFDVDGLRVILKHAPKEVVHVSLFVKGGVNNYPKAQEGIESMAFQFAMTGGTESMDKDAFNARADGTGTAFSGTSTYDFGALSMTCVRMFWEEAWSLYADAVMNPSFDEKEFELLKEQLVSAAKENAVDPDFHLRNIAMQSTFTGTVYERIPTGSPESLEALSYEAVKGYYSDILGKQRAFLVVVGDVTEKDIREKVTASMAGLPQGTAAQFEAHSLITEPGHYIEDRDIATNYIRGLMSAPSFDTQEGVTMWVAMAILRDRFFLELRTNRGLTYAPAAFYAIGVPMNPYNVLYASTTDPGQSIAVMVAELEKIKASGFEEKELRDMKQTMLTGYYMGQETTSAQATSLGMAEIIGGWELSETLTERVNNVSLDDLNRVFDKYSNTIRWTYLGKADMIDADDFLQPAGEALKRLD